MTTSSFAQPAALVAALAALVVATPSLAQAQEFAESPDGAPLIAQGPQDPPPDQGHYYQYDDSRDRYLPRSTVRVHTGPALRVSEDSPAGGLFAAIDIGERAAGLRVSGAWVKVGADSGTSQYAGELWIDFGHDKRLHPILGAGAGAARVDTRDPATGDLNPQTVGIGVLRGTLQYVLPVGDTDARASIDVIGAVPAIRSEAAEDVKPWMLAIATVGVGF